MFLLRIAIRALSQESHLGPLFFLIYFNNVNFVLEGPRLPFADDLKIYLKIKTHTNALFLQKQFDRFTVNPKKCSVILS